MQQKTIGKIILKQVRLMKKIILLFAISLISACSSSLPPPPEPKGEQIPVNPSVIYRSDLEA